MKKFKTSVAISGAIFSLVIFSCSSAVDTFGDEVLSIQTKNSTVVLTNNSDQIVYYVIVESKTATLIDLNPNYLEWPSIEPDSKLTIPYDEIMGYKDSANKAWITWGTGENGTGNSQTFRL